MRVIGNIPHPEIQITLFHWNNKYLIKLETPALEQTFKIPDFDLTGEDDLIKIVSDQFLENAISRFNDMTASLHQAMERL